LQWAQGYDKRNGAIVVCKLTEDSPDLADTARSGRAAGEVDCRELSYQIGSDRTASQARRKPIQGRSEQGMASIRGPGRAA
jgi:hypothetical protein